MLWCIVVSIICTISVIISVILILFYVNWLPFKGGIYLLWVFKWHENISLMCIFGPFSYQSYHGALTDFGIVNIK